MKTIRFAMFLFFRYYNTSKWGSPAYFRTLSSMSMLLFFHISSLLSFIGMGNLLFDGMGLFLIKFLVLYSLSIFLFQKIATKHELRKMKYESHQIKKGNWLLILYFVLSMALMGISISTISPKKKQSEKTNAVFI